jgi:pimeloyl-ACP methyl ester carboxylesterase
MKPKILPIIIALSFISFSGIGQDRYGVFTEAECPIKISEELASSGKFTFGYMTVPEFHGKEGSRAIELAVAIFKCIQEQATMEPLILNSGGPGMSNLEDFVPTLDGPLGSLFLNDRDVVIIELRGLQHSRPSLLSPALDKLQVELLDQHLKAEEIISQYSEAVRLAKKEYDKQGINLSAYNYWETASDLAFVMEKLGYEKFFAFGNSAGTIVAQYLLMEHSEHLAGLVLNAVVNVPPGFNNMIITSVDKLESIFSELKENEEYARAYPDLKMRFLNTIVELNESPETIKVRFQGEEEDSDIVLNGDRVVDWVFSQMYWNVQLPLSMHKIIHRDYSELVRNPGIFQPLTNFSNGSFWTMLLNGWTDPSQEQLLSGSEWEPFVKGMSTMVFSQPFVMQIRDILEVDYQPGHIKPMPTHVPTLMLNGGEDHLCLADSTRKLAESFDNAYCYIFEGIAHSPIDAGECAIMMMKQFLDNPHVAPDASCMEAFMKKPEFILP